MLPAAAAAPYGRLRTYRRPPQSVPLELDAVLDNLSGSGKMMQDITLLRRLWVLIVLLAVILCPYMAWIISRTWLSP